MSFGLEMENSWTMSPARCANSPEYMLCFASEHGFGMTSDRIHILWFGALLHCNAQYVALLICSIVGQGDS